MVIDRPIAIKLEANESLFVFAISLFDVWLFMRYLDKINDQLSPLNNYKLSKSEKFVKHKKTIFKIKCHMVISNPICTMQGKDNFLLFTP